MRNKLGGICKAILGLAAVFVAIFIILSFFVTVGFDADKNDLRLYRAAGALLLTALEIGILLELNLFNLRGKIPLIKSKSVGKHIIFWIIVLFVAGIAFSIPYNMTSSEFKSRLSAKDEAVDDANASDDADILPNDDKIAESENAVAATPGTNEQITDAVVDIAETVESAEPKDEALTWKKLSENAESYKKIMILLGEHFNERVYSEASFADLSPSEKQLVGGLFEYADKNNSLPTDFTQAFTEFCVGEEFENMFVESYDNPFYNALSASFVISWGSDNTYYIDMKDATAQEPSFTDEFVTEQAPLTYTFDDDNESVVGNCTVKLKKIEIVNTPHKPPTYAKHIRIQATVSNNSAQSTSLSCKRDGQLVIGKYHGADESINIGWNNSYKWKVDSDIKSDVEWTLEPQQAADICVSGVFINRDALKYTDKPQIELYFANDGETLTITV